MSCCLYCFCFVLLPTQQTSFLSSYATRSVVTHALWACQPLFVVVLGLLHCCPYYFASVLRSLLTAVLLTSCFGTDLVLSSRSRSLPFQASYPHTGSMKKQLKATMWSREGPSPCLPRFIAPTHTPGLDTADDKIDEVLEDPPAQAATRVSQIGSNTCSSLARSPDSYKCFLSVAWPITLNTNFVEPRPLICRPGDLTCSCCNLITFCTFWQPFGWLFPTKISPLHSA